MDFQVCNLFFIAEDDAYDEADDDASDVSQRWQTQNFTIFFTKNLPFL